MFQGLLPQDSTNPQSGVRQQRLRRPAPLHGYGQLRTSREKRLWPVAGRLEAQHHREHSERPAVATCFDIQQRFQQGEAAETARSLGFLRQPQRLQVRLEFHSLLHWPLRALRCELHGHRLELPASYPIFRGPIHRDAGRSVRRSPPTPTRWRSAGCFVNGNSVMTPPAEWNIWHHGPEHLPGLGLQERGFLRVQEPSSSRSGLAPNSGSSSLTCSITPFIANPYGATNGELFRR